MAQTKATKPNALRCVIIAGPMRSLPRTSDGGFIAAGRILKRPIALWRMGGRCMITPPSNSASSRKDHETTPQNQAGNRTRQNRRARRSSARPSAPAPSPANTGPPFMCNPTARWWRSNRSHPPPFILHPSPNWPRSSQLSTFISQLPENPLPHRQTLASRPASWTAWSPSTASSSTARRFPSASGSSRKTKTPAPNAVSGVKGTQPVKCGARVK